MPAPRFDHLHTYDELTAELEALAAAHPNLMTLEPVGTSFEGRSIWLATVTNREYGPHDEKPAVFFECNIHATEITASTAALHLLHHLTASYGPDAAVTRAVDTRAFYVMPRVNPDGVELELRTTDPIYLRSSTRRYPRPEQQPGLMERDADGDGRILLMRIEDPDGAWSVHPDDRRLMVPRPMDDVGDGPFYRLVPEGVVHDFDPDRVPMAPAHQGIDLNRNFPQDWKPEGDQPGAGRYPTSEPEVRTVVDAVTARPNVGVYFAYHTFAGVILRPFGGKADDQFPTADLVMYKTMGRRATEITGYETASVFHEFRYDPKGSITGCGDEWAYDVLGGDGFVDWYRFDHPQLGPVELGGWDTFRTWSNPPAPLGDGTYAIRAVVKNSGWMSTNITKRALERSAVRAVEATIECPAGVELLLGRATTELTQLPGRSRARTMMAVPNGLVDSTTDRAIAEWIVTGPSGATVSVAARHDRAGVARAQVQLP